MDVEVKIITFMSFAFLHFPEKHHSPTYGLLHIPYLDLKSITFVHRWLRNGWKIIP
jgi:hypothetical protein